MRRRVVLDCDTGTDDAVAIMLAAARPELDLVAVTAVWGNHAVERTADNSRRTLDLIGGSDIPVYAGRNGPVAPPPGAPAAIGSTEPDTLPLPPATTPLEPQDAVEWLVETARTATERFTLVPTGSLSNIASAVAADPTFVEAVEEIVIMGGVIERGGLLPEVETNVGYDPEAAQQVLDAGFERLVLVPLDATYRSTVTAEQCATLREAGGTAVGVAADFIEQRIERYRTLPAMQGRAAAPVHDALTVAYLVDPTLVTLRPATVRVHTGDSPTRGRTDIALDRAGTVHVATDPDADRFFDLLLNSLAGL
jgi:inosine-uridine nucleoside N-ribohydrolase